MTLSTHAVPTTTELLSSLVACPSINPGARGQFEAPYGELAMARLLQDILEPWADAFRTEEVLPGRPNVIATFRGKAGGPKRALEAHMDTVDVDGMHIEPFVPTVKDGQLYGRGSADTKGPMTAMLLALIRARAAGRQLNGDWYFISTCDEELGGKGAQHLVESGFRCDGIIVAEPTELSLIDAHKGVERYAISIDGRASHSAYPERGANAIHAMSEFICNLELTCQKKAQAYSGDDAIGPLTMSVGVISGGDQVNRVPQHATIEVDFRIPPGSTLDLVLNCMERAAEATCRRRNGIKIHWERTQHYSPLQPAPDSPFSQALTEHARQHLGNATPQSVRYATNAGFFSEAGIPCMVFGPGSIAEAHTASESIPLEQIERAARFLEAFITA